MTPQPLDAIRVLDFTSTLAGPSATRVMADFGAQVIKIESSHHPDTSRLGSPYAGDAPGVDRSGYFSAYNAGKLSFGLNLHHPLSRSVVRLLVQTADVLVESFAPGAMDRLGLDTETLRSWNPRLIVASHSLQGQTGPRRTQRGYGQLASALTGWFELTGEEGQEAVGPYSAYTDFIAWPFLLSSILIALEERDRTGVATVIDHSHVESSAYFAAPELVAAQLGTNPRRHGNRESYAVPSDAFLCSDGRWCALTVGSDAEWTRLCEVLGNETLSSDERFTTLAKRRQLQSELADLLADSIIRFTADDLAQRLRDAGVAASKVYQAEDLFSDDQLAWREAFRRVQHPVLGEHAVVAPAFTINSIPSGPYRGFPLLGEHTEMICREILKLSEAEIASLASTGIFE